MEAAYLAGLVAASAAAAKLASKGAAEGMRATANSMTHLQVPVLQITGPGSK